MEAFIIIDAISDLHGFLPCDLAGGDLLIICGDLTARDFENEHALFDYWINDQKYKKKIVIAGNHDNVLQEKRLKYQFCDYLCDSGTEFEGLKIWGSPWSRTFEGMNPYCKAFTCETEEELTEKWALIPEDTDILITHSPPHEILDQVYYIDHGKDQAEHVGSTSLKEYVLNKVKPKLWIWGHIHEAYGQGEIFLDYQNTIVCVNASHVNELFMPVNKPIRIIL